MNVHPHDAIINDLIIAIKRKQKDNHEIIVTIDGNELFVSTKGEISRLYKAYHLYDRLTHRHNLSTNISTCIRGTKHIYIISYAS